MNQANFDLVAPATEEFFCAPKTLTYSKRKVNPNLEQMKPEARQMEEQ
jgi:hypothetical protein